ncbi:hypothetical protein HKBW3S25_01931, partial [Candidatus Hakubella thermalkaliphila]
MLGAVHKELVEKEIAERLPSPSWAELLSGFSWVFNLREGNGELIYPDRKEGELICAVKKGIPDWPEPTQWDDESVILTWNYQFTENYLKVNKDSSSFSKMMRKTLLISASVLGSSLFSSWSTIALV